MLDFKEVSVYCPDAAMLIDELNAVLIGIVGNNGTKHLNLDDFEEPRSVFIVGYDDGEPVCCAGIRFFSEGVGEIKRVYARKNKKGYASQLMAQLEEWAACHGYTRLILECREINSHAIDFYKREGYTVCEKYTPYENQPDAICLDKFI